MEEADCCAEAAQANDAKTRKQQADLRILNMASNMPHRDEVVEGHRSAAAMEKKGREFASHFASERWMKKQHIVFLEYFVVLSNLNQAKAMLCELPVVSKIVTNGAKQEVTVSNPILTDLSFSVAKLGQWHGIWVFLAALEG